MRARRPIAIVVALIALAIALVPVFQLNLLGSSDAKFFSGWDRDSESLVLGNIERAEQGAPATQWALYAAQPNLQSVYDTFDGLGSGAAATATHYIAYTSSLDLQGRLFTAAYSVGCRSVGCLEGLESTLFAVVLVAFLAALALVTRRSLALVVLGCAVLSPWVVASAHNLYWVPWTWLLPAIAACAVVGARSGRRRIIAVVLVGIASGLKSGTGYEFLTTTTLLAVSIPVIAHLIGRRRSVRAVALDAAAVFVACVAGFVAVLTVHAFVSGDGSAFVGLQHIVDDAMKRTYGSPALGSDQLTVQSLQVSPLQVVLIYLIRWTTPLFSVGLNGASSTLSLGPGTFWVALVTAVAIVVFRAFRGHPLWRRDAVLLLVGLAPAVSWFVLAKSHAYAAYTVTYVLWYLIFVPLLVWIIGSAVVDGGRAAFRLATGYGAATGRRAATAAQDRPTSPTPEAAPTAALPEREGPDLALVPQEPIAD